MNELRNKERFTPNDNAVLLFATGRVLALGHGEQIVAFHGSFEAGHDVCVNCCVVWGELTRTFLGYRVDYEDDVKFVALVFANYGAVCFNGTLRLFSKVRRWSHYIFFCTFFRNHLVVRTRSE